MINSVAHPPASPEAGPPWAARISWLLRCAAQPTAPDVYSFSVRSRSPGQGFDVEGVREGLGLRGMRERALTLGGRLEIHAQPGQTRVEVFVPGEGESGIPRPGDV